MNAFDERYANLNTQQQQAVDAIDGPLLVIAGPGTGKTELLSMRTANILRQTDTLPGNILCLTFTDSGANAMRERLTGIIGPDAYKVAIHTFHSFGSEVINQNAEYFYHGASVSPADELTTFEILRSIFDELDHTNPLASKMKGDYVHLRSVSKAISELKRSGLSSDELLSIITANEAVLDSVESELSEIFANKISVSLLTQLAPLAKKVAELPSTELPIGITPLNNILALSMAHAFDEAVTINKTTPITAWRNEWLQLNAQKRFVFKDRKRYAKLRALSHVYFTYLSRMEHAGLYDFDDMILNVVHAIETQPDLKYNLQEKYQYIMVDEFQDTNLAQLRILFNLAENPISGDEPNVMAVGDDDQAIYSFQGADLNNIHAYRNHFSSALLIPLVDNYRSAPEILEHAREVITQGEGRLEDTIADLSKKLTPHFEPDNAITELSEHKNAIDERAWLAHHIASAIKSGKSPDDITVLARKHSELLELLPYLYNEHIAVNYERRDNVLELPVISAIRLVAQIVIAIQSGNHDRADSLLPSLLAHESFSFTAELIWKVSLDSYKKHQLWLETIATFPELASLHAWLIELSKQSATLPLENILDTIIGLPSEATQETFTSPLYAYYFSDTAEPETYLTMLEGLRTIRQKLRDYHPDQTLTLRDFVEFIALHERMNIGITSIRKSSEHSSGSINLMTSHKSKGLEYDTIYIINAIDTAWGERVRTMASFISYPANLQQLTTAGGNYSERVRLFFVSMTRAKRELYISYATEDINGKPTLPASFITGTSLNPTTEAEVKSAVSTASVHEVAWKDSVVDVSHKTMQELLAPLLSTYKLSATHLNNFTDITDGGPLGFVMKNLLHFPQAKSANASYGTAVHSALQRAHMHLATTGDLRPAEDVLRDFETELAKQHLPEQDYALFQKKGIASLSAFLNQNYHTFSTTQKTELGFSNQGVVLNEARLTGALDLIDIANKTITVTDYKTGKPSSSWKGAQDYEKIKLHKYKQQLMFYELLTRYSRDYSTYKYMGGNLQFVEPDEAGEIHCLSADYTQDELDRFAKLVTAVWNHIMAYDFPDTSSYEQNYKGLLAFEEWLIDNSQ